MAAESKMDIRKTIDDLKAEHQVQMELVEFYRMQGVENTELCRMARHSASVISGAICLLEDYQQLLGNQK